MSDKQWLVVALLVFYGAPSLIVWLAEEGLPEYRQWRARYRQNRAPCLHGINGGVINGACQDCKSIQLTNQAKEVEYQRQAIEDKKARAEEQTRRFKDLERIKSQNAHKLEYLLALPPYDFETAVAKMYLAMGYAVTQTPASNDFGRDLILVKDGKTTFVECKRYAPDKLIGRPALQKFYAAVATMNAQAGIVVTTSAFAYTAIKFARQNDIQLVDGKLLVQLMIRAFPPNPTPI
ncbi:MAG: restriction endonuclease [Pseudomonadota bacterium]